MIPPGQNGQGLSTAVAGVVAAAAKKKAMVLCKSFISIMFVVLCLLMIMMIDLDRMLLGACIWLDA